jgi:cob(I)alamin adenosyltransferase
MSLFYTGKGDKGASDLGKQKIKKTRPEIEAVGALDELNSLLGLVKNQSFGRLSRLFKNVICDIQEDLFIIQAHVGAAMVGGKFIPPAFTGGKAAKLEKLINDFERKIKPGRGFIVYGATEGTGWLDYARAVARRAEQSVLKIRSKLQPEIFSYLNRLSSLLYAMARLAVKKSGEKEKNPRYR